jgi:hypothetical protein
LVSQRVSTTAPCRPGRSAAEIREPVIRSLSDFSSRLPHGILDPGLTADASNLDDKSGPLEPVPTKWLCANNVVKIDKSPLCVLSFAIEAGDFANAVWFEKFGEFI